MFKLNHIFFFGLILSFYLFIAKQAFAQQHMAAETSGNKVTHEKPMERSMQSLDQMIKQMQQMMNQSGSMIRNMHGQNGMGMMMMGSDQNWSNMMKGTDDMVKNMDQVMEQLQSMMQNKNLIKNEQLTDHLESMQQNMSEMMQSMQGFLNNVQDVQKLQNTTKN